MIKVQHLLTLSLTAAFAAQVNAASNVTSIQFEGAISQPTCVATTDTTTVTLPIVATTAFKDVDGFKVAGTTPFALKLIQTGADKGAEGEICPSVSYAMDANGKTTPNIKISSTNQFIKEGYLKNTADTREDEKHTVAIQITDSSGKEINLSEDSTMAAYNEETGTLSYQARYIALAEKVEVQTVAAALSFSVEYR